MTSRKHTLSGERPMGFLTSSELTPTVTSRKRTDWWASGGFSDLKRTHTNSDFTQTHWLVSVLRILGLHVVDTHWYAVSGFCCCCYLYLAWWTHTGKCPTGCPLEVTTTDWCGGRCFVGVVFHGNWHFCLSFLNWYVQETKNPAK